jgi:tRNA dimethylallyltransferase
VQVYRGFDIGSAKASAHDRARVPHHLIDIREPLEIYTAGDFARDVTVLLPSIDLPILCGGTGFYLRALLRGLSPSPQRDDALRADLERRDVRRLLERLDPAAARRIHPNDKNKSLRALELRILARRSSTELFAEQPLAPLAGYVCLLLGVDPPREELYARLDARCEAMWHGGLLDEARALLPFAESKPFESLGYKQALAHLRGRPADECLEEMKVKTRQYAKRQWTWFRAEPDIVWLRGFGGDAELQHEAEKKISSFAEHFRG